MIGVSSPAVSSTSRSAKATPRRRGEMTAISCLEKVVQHEAVLEIRVDIGDGRDLAILPSSMRSFILLLIQFVNTFFLAMRQPSPRPDILHEHELEPRRCAP